MQLDLSAHDDIEEQKLLNRYRQTGDQKWLGELYTPYMELIYGVCLKYLKDIPSAKDAVMDIYELVSKKLKTHEVAQLRPWLYVVAKNHCYEILRKSNRQRDKESVAKDVYSETIFHPDDVSKETMLNKMEQCMKKLSTEQKNCINAFYYQSMSYTLIAKKYEIEWKKVRSYIQNGRRNLKNCLDAK